MERVLPGKSITAAAGGPKNSDSADAFPEPVSVCKASYWDLIPGLVIEDDRENGDVVCLTEVEGGLGDGAGW
jgi:hypothetical protein